MKARILIEWLPIIGLCAGCVGTEVGNPQDVEEEQTEVSFEFAAVAPAPNALTLANGLEIDRAFLAVEELGLRRASDCDGDNRLDLERPFSVDIVTGDTQPALGPVLRPAVSYCRLEIEISAPEARDGLPAELDGKSVWVTGSTADGTPFEISLQESDELRIDGEFTLERGGDALIVGFDLASWVSPAELESVIPADDGVIRIDSDNGDSEELVSDILKNVADSITLFRDINNNGRLDTGEDVVIGVGSSESEEEENL